MRCSLPLLIQCVQSTRVLIAPRLGVSDVTPRGGAAVLAPIGSAYYLFWRYGVSFLNWVIGLDRAENDAKGIE